MSPSDSPKFPFFDMANYDWLSIKYAVSLLCRLVQIPGVSWKVPGAFSASVQRPIFATRKVRCTNDGQSKFRGIKRWILLSETMISESNPSEIRLRLSSGSEVGYLQEPWGPQRAHLAMKLPRNMDSQQLGKLCRFLPVPLGGRIVSGLRWFCCEIIARSVG